MVAIADPVIAQELYKNQSNMAHAWDLGLGHFAFRYMGDSMGFAQGRKWSGHKSAFRTSLSSTAADSSLTNIAATLDEWESDILEPLAKSGDTLSGNPCLEKKNVLVWRLLQKSNLCIS